MDRQLQEKRRRGVLTPTDECRVKGHDTGPGDVVWTDRETRWWKVCVRCGAEVAGGAWAGPGRESACFGVTDSDRD